ncbi:hypothetical protein UFOVP824_30 [uncultured Caudovirales phage]|uniref:Uncharacterized protein n=1 Tax=uncultured Caudovirales phage TaxID=2100421 RepID=A0A6J5NZI8_9CAUD|nr:hypothetical protein UFOVP824_30 [uncultured Caudovirales phage]
MAAGRSENPMQSELAIWLPWPAAALSPNSRARWQVLYQAKKRARRQAALVTMSQVPYRFDGKPPFHLHMTFYPPSRRSYDLDNLVGRMKAPIDGMCDSLNINDKNFKSTSQRLADYDSDKACKGGLVRLVITMPRETNDKASA